VKGTWSLTGRENINCRQMRTKGQGALSIYGRLKKNYTITHFIKYYLGDIAKIR
jgi:hypothetical protein